MYGCSALRSGFTVLFQSAANAGAEPEPRRALGAQAPAVNGARRWDETRLQARNTSWNGEPREQPIREPRDADATWRSPYPNQPKNNIHWRKAGDPPGPAGRPNGARCCACLLHTVA